MKTIENLGCSLYAGAAYPRVNTVNDIFVPLQEPPNLSELMKPIQNASSPASLGLKDEDDDDAEAEDGEGEGEKVDPTNINPERLKAFNVSRVIIQGSKKNLNSSLPFGKAALTFACPGSLLACRS